MNTKLISTRSAVISLALLMFNAGPVLAGNITLSGATGNSCSYSNVTVDSNGNLTAACVVASSTPTLTPTCSLAASPSLINAGGTSTLTATCSPAATSYLWAGAGTESFTTHSGTVTPSVTTTYSVKGTNGDGPGNTAYASVSISVQAPIGSGSGIAPTSNSPLEEIKRWNKAFAGINYMPYDSRAEPVSLMSYNKQMQAAKPIQYKMPLVW